MSREEFHSDILKKMREHINSTYGIPKSFFEKEPHPEEETKPPDDYLEDKICIDGGIWTVILGVDPAVEEPKKEREIIVYKCERCKKTPRKLLSIIGKDIRNDRVLLCQPCKKAFDAFIIRNYGLSAFIKSTFGTRVVYNGR